MNILKKNQPIKFLLCSIKENERILQERMSSQDLTQQ
jgi:hypothetical protein